MSVRHADALLSIFQGSFETDVELRITCTGPECPFSEDCLQAGDDDGEECRHIPSRIAALEALMNITLEEMGVMKRALRNDAEYTERGGKKSAGLAAAYAAYSQQFQEDRVSPDPRIRATQMLLDDVGHIGLTRVRGLLKAGADPNAVTPDGWTALMLCAAEEEDPEVIKALLDAGADLDKRDNAGKTALMWAATHNNNPEVVKTLLAAGADTCAKDEFGDTALMCAAGNENPAVVQALLDAGGKEDV